MTRERIEDFREIVLPFLSRTLLETNYENLGRSDAEEFEKDFNEILNLAIKALEQEPILDKIKAEIEQNAYPIVHGVNNYEKGMTLYGILQVIDKYKADVESRESEDQE